MDACRVFFRNDDVNHMEPGLLEITDLLNSSGIPVCHGVEPANLTEEVRLWLLEQDPSRVEIIQHGFAHRKHDLGEFGGSRGRAEQYSDLVDGQRIMQEAFGSRFFPAMCFPFGSYNRFTIPILDELGYEVVSCHRRCQQSRAFFYWAGRLLKKGRWFGRHVSHHLECYPGSRVFEISVSISPIRRYFPDSGPTACDFWSQEELRKSFLECRCRSPVVGIVLHHRYHGTPESLKILAEFVDWLQKQEGIQFETLEGIRGNGA